MVAALWLKHSWIDPCANLDKAPTRAGGRVLPDGGKGPTRCVLVVATGDTPANSDLRASVTKTPPGGPEPGGPSIAQRHVPCLVPAEGRGSGDTSARAAGPRKPRPSQRIFCPVFAQSFMN
jgi:hypothetical protein